MAESESDKPLIQVENTAMGKAAQTSHQPVDPEQAAKIQATIYEISQAAYSADRLEELYYQIHTILGRLMPAENFFIAIYDATEDVLSFPYFVDAFDEKPQAHKPGRGMTEYILRTGRPLLAQPDLILELEKNGEIIDLGTPSLDWLGVPLKVKDRTIGVMTVQSYEENVRYGTDELNILTFVSTQVAMVIERKRAEEELTQRQKDLQTLLDGIPGYVFFKDTNGLYRMANKKFCDAVAIKQDQIIGKTDFQIFPKYLAEKYQNDDRDVIEKGRPLLVGEEERLEGNSTITITTRKVPLKDDEGRVAGLIGLSFDVSEIKEAERTLRETQAQLAQRVNELERRTHEITLLTELVNMLQICTQPSEAYSVISQIGQQLFPDLDGELCLLDKTQHILEIHSSWGDQPAGSIVSFHPEDCWALRRARPYIVLEASASILCKHVGDLADPTDYICVPVVSQGKDVGVLHLRTRQGVPLLTSAHQQLAQAVTEQIGLALSNLQLRENLHQQALLDPLSGLYNRYFMQASLENELDHARRSVYPVSVIMVDIDHFREINASIGHSQADELLSEFGNLLKISKRTGDVAGRYGGDEFLLILPDTTLEIAGQRAEKLRNQVKNITFLSEDGHLMTMSASLGVACFPDQGSTASALLMAMDAAMVQAKSQGRDRVILAGSHLD